MSHIWMSHVSRRNESCHACEGVMPHSCNACMQQRCVSAQRCVSHVSHMNESCHTQRCMSHVLRLYVTLVWDTTHLYVRYDSSVLWCVTHDDVSDVYSYVDVTCSHVCLSPYSHVFPSPCSHVCLSLFTCVSIAVPSSSCHTYEPVMSHTHEWVMSRVWMSLGTQVHESCLTYKRVMSRV